MKEEAATKVNDLQNIICGDDVEVEDLEDQFMQPVVARTAQMQVCVCMNIRLNVMMRLKGCDEFTKHKDAVLTNQRSRSTTIAGNDEEDQYNDYNAVTLPSTKSDASYLSRI